jgi:acetyl esterase/lipase
VLQYRTDQTPRDVDGFTAAVGRRVSEISAGDGRLDAPPMALEDAEAAVRLVRARAASWKVDPARVGFIGFSAGAVTALGLGLTDDKAARPDFIAPIYGSMVSRKVSVDAPPMFLAIALDDPLFAKGKSLGLVDSWRAARRPVEAHFYERGAHGFASGTSAATKLWEKEFLAWMQDRGLLARKP